MRNKLVRQRGFTVVEAVVAMSVFAIAIVGGIQTVLTAQRLSNEGKDTIQAANYLEEGLEAVRSIRDSSWTDIATAGPYHLTSDTGAITPWQLIPDGSETLGKFTRTIEIADVRRADTDGSGTLSAEDNIVQSGGEFDDPDTKRITATVSWEEDSRTVTRSISTYLTNWQQ